MSDRATDRRWMALALSLGARGLGRVWPNPAVGCVVVRGDRVMGRGWTQDNGRPHGERMALDRATQDVRGATAYVTLEPCAHDGLTPPCARALIEAGIARVVVAITDPDPRVAGRGIMMLREAGLEVLEGVLEDRARRAHAGFFSRVERGRPWVTLKLASSFDGRIATASGESQWITGPAARRAVHALRARYDAVMVGGGTARGDDPSLTVRGLGISRQPVRVVVSSLLNIPPAGTLGKTAGDAPVWVLHGARASAERWTAWADLGAQLFEVDTQDSGAIDMLAALDALGQAGLTRVFCEGGGALASSLLRAGLVDELIGFTAGVTLGAEGLASIGGLSLSSLSDAARFELVDVEQIGGDVMHRWIRPPP